MTCLPASSHGTADIARELSEPTPDADELKREIERKAEPVALPPNCIVFREGDPSRQVYLLQKGEISFTIRAGGHVVACFAVGSGSLVGLSAVIAGAPFALTATASPGAELLKMEASEFIGLIESRAEWYMCALRALAAETLQAHHALANMLAS